MYWKIWLGPCSESKLKTRDMENKALKEKIKQLETRLDTFKYFKRNSSMRKKEFKQLEKLGVANPNFVLSADGDENLEPVEHLQRFNGPTCRIKQWRYYR